MKKSVFAALFTLIVIINTLFSCDKATLNAKPKYSTDYAKAVPKSKIFIHLYGHAKSIYECIEEAEIIAEIKILGLSGIYQEESIPLSIYVGKVLECFKGETIPDQYIYIARYGTAESVVSDLNILKPDDDLILFLKAYDYTANYTEQPLYCGCYNGFFESLYVYERCGIKYVLPDTLDSFLPNDIYEIENDLAADINNSAIITRHSKKVFDYETIKKIITTGD